LFLSIEIKVLYAKVYTIRFYLIESLYVRVSAHPNYWWAESLYVITVSYAYTNSQNLIVKSAKNLFHGKVNFGLLVHISTHAQTFFLLIFSKRFQLKFYFVSLLYVIVNVTAEDWLK